MHDACRVRHRKSSAIAWASRAPIDTSSVLTITLLAAPP